MMAECSGLGRVSGTGRAMSRTAFVVLAVLLLLVLACELVLSIREQSQTFDEAAHIVAGYQYWRNWDFGANAEHPPLVKLLATIPLLWSPLPEVALPQMDSKDLTYQRGKQILYSGDADLILFRTRLAASALTYLLAVLVLLCGYEMFGAGPALLGLLLLVFEPNILAHGALVTTDIGVTCFLFAAVYAFYRYVKRPALGRLFTCGCAVALAWSSKHSALLLVPILVLLVLGELSSQRRSRRVDGSNSSRIEAPARPSLRLAIAILVVFVLGLIGLWLCYGFRFAARPNGGALFPPLGLLARTLDSRLESAAIRAVARAHLLPESYLWGLADVFNGAEGRPMFLLGTVYATGRWFYFPVAFLVKSTLGFVFLLSLVPFSGLLHGWPRREVMFLMIPPVFYFGISMASGMNLGIRHILPVFPFLIVVAAASAWSFMLRSRIAIYIIAAIILSHAFSSLHAFPNYLTYSNEAAGGPSTTYRLVSDSNADWGQGLKQVQRYLTRKNITACWFAYSTPMVDPGYYHIPCSPLPSAGAYRLGVSTAVQSPSVEGVVLISAFEAAGQQWGPGELNPYKVFFDKKPDDMIGNSILVFRGSFEVSLAAAISRVIMAQEMLQQRRFKEALAESQAAIHLAPNSAEIQANLCEVLREMNRKAEAQPACQTALAIAHKVHPDYQFLWGPRVREVVDMQ